MTSNYITDYAPNSFHVHTDHSGGNIMADHEAYGLRVAGEEFSCVACKQGTRFFQREIRLNTGGMTLLGLDWLNKAADGAVCERCGYVHSFLGDNHEWV